MKSGFNQSRSYCVHANAFGCDLAGQSNCETVDGAFRCRVVDPFSSGTGAGRNRRDIDDGATDPSAGCRHAPNGLAGTEHGACDVDGKHFCESACSDILNASETARNAGIVH